MSKDNIWVYPTPETAAIDEEMNTSVEDLNRVLDLYRSDEMEYEAKCFAASCVYDASDELPF